MLKLIFWSLLAANAALFAYHQGYFDGFTPSGHEPDRLARQINADRIKLIPAAALAVKASAAAASAASAGADAAETGTPPLAACTEIGNFTQAEAKRFEQRLASLALGERQSRHNVQEVA